MDKNISKWVWLALPVSVVLMAYIARSIGVHTDNVMYGEMGVIENLTVLFLFVAIISTVLFLKSNKTNFKLLSVWMGIFLLGAVYYAGEELSWGQHFIGWNTPEQWTEINDQQETNLHNTNGLFDQVPRTLLSLAAIIGGVLIPLHRKRTHHVPDQNSLVDWVFPTMVCLPAALLTVLVSWQKVYETVGSSIPVALDIKSGETKECMLALFMMMYALSIYYRNKHVKVSQVEAEETDREPALLAA